MVFLETWMLRFNLNRAFWNEHPDSIELHLGGMTAYDHESKGVYAVRPVGMPPQFTKRVTQLRFTQRFTQLNTLDCPVQSG
jgi:hypothetical protein